ncbi:unnamed protein product, partial [Ceratitis capitata]
MKSVPNLVTKQSRNKSRIGSEQSWNSPDVSPIAQIPKMAQSGTSPVQIYQHGTTKYRRIKHN